MVTTKAYLEKILKKMKYMHMSKPTSVPIVKGNSFGNVSVPGTNKRWK